MAIIEALRTNPSADLATIARSANIPRSTLYKRLRRLRKAGIVANPFVLCPHSEAFPLRAKISLDFDVQQLHSKEYGYFSERTFVAFLKDKLLRLPKFTKQTHGIRIDEVAIVLGGREDAYAIVGATDALALSDFVTEVIRILPGVRATNTATLVPPVDRLNCASAAHQPASSASSV